MLDAVEKAIDYVTEFVLDSVIATPTDSFACGNDRLGPLAAEHRLRKPTEVATGARVAVRKQDAARG
ncbi:hypothetical protein JCM17478_34990 [Thermopirellula anaerolimosa]